MRKKSLDTGVYVSHSKKLVATVQGTQANTLLLKAMRGESSFENHSVGANILKMNEDASSFERVGDFKVSPWGDDNLMPNKLLRILSENNLAPGLLEFKEDMVFGKGIMFVDENHRMIVDKEVEEWLSSWNYEDYILSQIVDFNSLYNTFGQFIKNKGNSRIAKIEHVPAQECRCEVMQDKQVKHILVADWLNASNKAVNYKVFDPTIELSKQDNITMYHNFRPTAGNKYYAVPKYIGSTRYWIPLVNKIPQYHLSMIDNSLNALYHVEVPMEALQGLRALKSWTQEELNTWINNTLESIEEMLTGPSNAGKTLFTYKSVDPASKQEIRWTITAIDNKMKTLSEGYLRLFNDGNQAITSAFQVQPSLACVQLGDKMSSGSEILNAYNLHMQTRTQIPRKIILGPLALALKINFPNKMILPKFEDIILVKQEDSKTGLPKNTEE